MTNATNQEEVIKATTEEIETMKQMKQQLEYLVAKAMEAGEPIFLQSLLPSDPSERETLMNNLLEAGLITEADAVAVTHFDQP